MGILLYILSTILTVIFLPVGIVYGFIKTIWKRQFFKALKDVDTKFVTMAVVVDFFGNIICAELFNSILISKNSKCRFGKRKETISSVLGKNERDQTLTGLGKILCQLLNKLQAGHTVSSIDDMV